MLWTLEELWRREYGCKRLFRLMCKGLHMYAR
jgi:hypothetical protein